MTQPSPTPSNGPLSLAALTELSLGTPRQSFPLSESQAASVQKLGALWSIVSKQAVALFHRNEGSLARLSEEARAELTATPSLFSAPWATYGQATVALRANKSVDLQEVRTLCNGLHELAALGILLASYGTPSFLLHAYSQAIGVADGSKKPHPHLRRLYTHPLTLNALNTQLSSIGGSSITLSSLPSGEAAQHALARLRDECARVPFAHTKEDCLGERIQSLARNPASQPERLLVITSGNHASLLTARLRMRAPKDFVESIAEALPHESSVTPKRPSVVVCSPNNAHLMATGEFTSVVMYSPLFVERGSLNALSAAAVNQLRALFAQVEPSILTTSPELFALDDRVAQTLTLPPFEPVKVPPAPMPPPPSSPSTQSLPPRHTEGRRGAVTVELPRPVERMLFDEATLQSLLPPPSTKPPVRPLPVIDPTELPKEVTQLNTALGITLIKDSLIPREDQIQELFRMLASGSFNWLYKSPTGSGKTAFASLVMAIRLGDSPRTPQSCRRGYRVAYVTPNVDLCPQAKDEFLRFIDLKGEEISILHGKTPLSKRREHLADTSNKILVGTPGTLRTSLTNAPMGRGYDSLGLMIVDEFQTAEGAHEMARIIREVSAAQVPILVLSGTPVRHEEDLLAKQTLLPNLEGALVPQIPQPLKNHASIQSRVTPQLLTLIEELGHFSLVPYIDAREQLLNGRAFFNQAEGLETKTLFDNRQKLKRKPHLISFSPPTADRLSELKAELETLRTDVKAAIQRRRDAGIPEGELLGKASKEVANASLNLGRMGSINASLAPLSSGGRFPFLFDFTESWFPHILESSRRGGTLPLYQTFMRSPDYRGILREVAHGTPFYHLLQATSGRDALQRAFNIPADQIPTSAKDRQALFANLATREMARQATVDNEKEQKLFEHIEERIASREARGILIFAEPRYLTRYLALRLHHRFHGRGVTVAFVTGEGDGFAEDLASSLDTLHMDPAKPTPRYTSPFAAIRSAFEAPADGTARRADIIVATSRLAVGHNLSAASEAHLYTMHADAQRLLQTIGRTGRPKGDNFFGRVGQCYYHVTQNTFERYLFLSAIRKYTWMRNSLTTSESWQEISPSDGGADAGARLPLPPS